MKEVRTTEGRAGFSPDDDACVCDGRRTPCGVGAGRHFLRARTLASALHLPQSRQAAVRSARAACCHTQHGAGQVHQAGFRARVSGRRPKHSLRGRRRAEAAMRVVRTAALTPWRSFSPRRAALPRRRATGDQVVPHGDTQGDTHEPLQPARAGRRGRSRPPAHALLTRSHLVRRRTASSCELSRRSRPPRAPDRLSMTPAGAGGSGATRGMVGDGRRRCAEN